MSGRANPNPVELIRQLRGRKRLQNAIKQECTDPVKMSDGSKHDCFLCVHGVPKDDYVIFGEDIVAKQGKNKCDCTIVHVQANGAQVVICVILLEIKSNLAHSLNEAKGQLADTNETITKILKGLIRSARSVFADARVVTLFAIMCPPVRADELKTIHNEMNLRIEGDEHQMIYLACGEHLVKDLVDRF